jgi:TolA-binding protein
MTRPPRALQLHTYLAAALLALVCSTAPLRAQEGGEMAQIYQSGMAAFQAGEFAKAAEQLEAVIARAEFSPQLEPIFYTVGSAWFNAGDYKKATAAFNRYLKQFPSGPRVTEVQFGLAQSALLSKDFGAAAKQFSALEGNPRMREQALLAQAQAHRDGKKIDEAIATLERLVGGEITTQAGARGLMMLAQLHGQKGAADKAIAALRKLHQNVRLVDNIVELNALTVELGDQLFNKKQFDQALEAYRSALRRDQIIRWQTDRITAMQQQMEDNVAAARADPAQVAQLGTTNAQLRNDIANAQRLLTEFQKLPDITPAIYVRLARCFYETDKKWEAIVVYQELLDRFPDAAEREASLFGIIVSLAEVDQGERAMKRCDEYLKEFPKGPNAETVAYLRGATALQANDARAAESHFKALLDTQPKSQFREQVQYLLANAKFMSGQYDEAAASYKKYLSEYPKGANVEDVNYRIALTSLFSGKYEEAMNALGDYIKKNPQGQFVSDAKYRLAVCKYAASLYDEVIADCKQWEAEYGDNHQLGEVLALLGDAYAATDREKEAIPVYIRSYQKATTDEVMNYSLFAASKLLQKRDEWARVSELFQGFINDKPDHPSVITALYWIGRAKAREGNTDEAKRITADTIKKYIGDPQREAVEMLLTQLAQLCVRKRRAEPAVAAAPVIPAADGAQPVEAAATPPPAPEPPPVDPGAELEMLLAVKEGEGEQNATAQARIVYSKAELARLRRQPAEEEKNIARIATEFKPEDLSPILLGRAGDHLLAKGEHDRARTFYQRLMDEFPKSDYVDFAYAGLGEIALQKGEHKRALRYFTDGTEKIAAATKLKDVTLGRGKALLALGELDDARKVFEQVAAVREWRGEATAFSVYSLGEIEAKRNRWAEANAFYQRVYVGYQKFLPWVAKAYLRSAESFEKLGKTQEAANTYREMLRNEKLASFSEAEEARRRLAALGQG